MEYICDKCGNPTDNSWAYKDHFDIEWLTRTGLVDKVVHTCDECEQAEVDFEEWQNEQYKEDTIVCPWCGYEFESYENTYEEDSDEIDCPSCGEPIEIEVHLEYSWTSRKPKSAYEKQLPNE